MNRLRQIGWGRWLLLLLSAALLWWIFSTVSLRAVWQVLAELRPAEIVALAAVNGLVLVTLCGRWWLFLMAQGHAVPFLRLVTYRLTAFGISYVTPGPHFGGEPWQVYVVNRRHNVPVADAIAAVTLDKIVEMLINFAFLIVGVVFVLRAQLWSAPDAGATPSTATDTAQAWLPELMLSLLAMLALPVVLLITYRRGYQPVSHALVWATTRLHRFGSRTDSADSAAPAPTPDLSTRAWFHTLRRSEAQIGRLCRARAGFVAAAFAVSILSWLGIVFEFWLMTYMLGLELTLADAVTALVAARVAILLPMPAALGALEAGQALVMSGLGRAPAAGVGLALLIRARDSLLALLGIWFGIWLGGFGLWDILRGRTPQTLPQTPPPTRPPTSPPTQAATPTSALK